MLLVGFGIFLLFGHNGHCPSISNPIAYHLHNMLGSFCEFHLVDVWNTAGSY